MNTTPAVPVDATFRAVYLQACRAGHDAAMRCREGTEPLCGFASVIIPAPSLFGQWLWHSGYAEVDTDDARTMYTHNVTGYEVRGGASWRRRTAYAHAFAHSLRFRGIEARVWTALD